MSDNKHTGKRWNGKGYYIALVLCAAAIGITSYVYSHNAETTRQMLAQEGPELPAATLAPEEDVPVLATQPTARATQPTQPAQPAQPTQPPEPSRKLQVRVPVAGQEIFGYSMETLSYNGTTRDWRVHNGVDFAAEEGTPVCAAAEGTVEAVYEDEALGHTLVLRHAGGYTTRYASLQEAPDLQVGDTVSLGQTIGCAGTSALVETALGSHVHFSVTHQDQPMDPAQFLALGE